MTNDEAMQAMREGRLSLNDICDMEERGEIDISLPLESGGHNSLRDMLGALQDNMSQALSEIGKRFTMPDMSALAASLREAAAVFERIRPFFAMIQEAYPDKTAWYMHQPFGIIVAPIGAYMRDRGLDSPEGAEAYREDFLTFFGAYIQGMEAAYKADHDYDIVAAQEDVFKLLKAKGLLKGDIGAAVESGAISVMEASKGYSFIRQSNLSHDFMGVRPHTGNVTLDELTGDLRIDEDGLITFIERSTDLKGGLKDTTKRFLLIILRQATKYGMQSDLVIMTLKEYMELCGLTDAKWARQQVAEDMATLYSISLSSKGSRNNAQDFAHIRLCSAQEINNGIIKFRMGQDFFAMACKWSLMPYPDNAFKLNQRHNPHGLYLATALARHKYMNKGKLNESIIGVKTLLDKCPGLPRYNELDTKKGEISRRIIEPFERDMDALVEVQAIGSWEYCHSKGAPLSDEELEAQVSYADWSSRLIHFDMPEYPNQQKRPAGKEHPERG